MELDLQDFDIARGILEMTEIKMGKTFGGLGKAKYSDATERVIEYVKMVGTTTRSVLMAKFYRDIDAFALRSIEDIMTQMKVVEIRLIPDKGEKVYTWVEKKPSEK